MMTVASSSGSALEKLAPQALEAEQSVLGSILIDADAILRVADFLHPADFYKAAPEHIRTVLARIEEVGQELEAALERWIELEEIGKA